MKLGHQKSRPGVGNLRGGNCKEARLSHGRVSPLGDSLLRVQMARGLTGHPVVKSFLSSWSLSLSVHIGAETSGGVFNALF